MEKEILPYQFYNETSPNMKEVLLDDFTADYSEVDEFEFIDNA